MTKKTFVKSGQSTQPKAAKTIVTVTKAGAVPTEEKEPMTNPVEQATEAQNPPETPAVDQGIVETPAVAEPEQAPAEAAAPVVTEQAPEAAPAATEEVVTAAPAAKTAKEDKAETSALDTKLDKLAAEGTTLQKTIVQTLRDYVAAMRPGRIILDEVINQQQLQLWRIIRLVIESEADFKENYTLLIEFAREHQEGAFNDRYLYRGMETINLDKEQTRHFQGSLNVLKLAATSKNKREAMAQVDLDRVMNVNVFSEDGRNRVIAYFK